MLDQPFGDNTTRNIHGWWTSPCRSMWDVARKEADKKSHV